MTPPRNRGDSGLGLAHLQGPERASERLSEPRKARSIGAAESKRRRERGKRAEREAAHLWRANGWPNARRQYASGAMRGAGGEVILPGDIAGVNPWCPVEVKYQEVAAKVGRGWPGDAFVRATIKKLLSEWATRPAGALWYPCLMVRVSVPGRKALEGWRIFVPSGLFVVVMRGDDPEALSYSRGLAPYPMYEWVSLDAHTFFGEVARAVPQA